MRPEKHNLHFLVGVELLPHAFVNIPDEKMHIGVFLYIFICYFIFMYFLYYKNYLYISIQFSSGYTIVTVISISYLSFSPLVPNVKCIAWNFDGSNFVSLDCKKEDLKRLRFENGDIIQDVESCFYL
jgi:hypothetical protein